MNHDLKERLQRVTGLIARLRAAQASDSRDAALEILETLMEFHASAIDRMMEIASEAGDPGWDLIDKFGADELIANVLLLHGLHPVDLETRVESALKKVRPYLRSHGGNVELLQIVDGAVRLRLIGSCQGCPSSTQTFRTAIETAIYDKAPDVVRIECDGAPEQTEKQGRKAEQSEIHHSAA
jgi:Fe-S cluster biogenesis protein NfuA